MFPEESKIIYTKLKTNNIYSQKILSLNSNISHLDKDASYYLKFLNKPSSSLLDIDEYLDDILKTLYKEELLTKPNFEYMKMQTEVNSLIRTILIGWLLDIHLKFKLVPNTLFLTINILDRFLSYLEIDKKHIQLIGCSAMLIASKYEDIYAPEVKDFKYACSNTYTEEQFLKAEYEILKVLNFDILNVTSFTILEAFGFCLNLSNFEFNFIRMLLEFSLHDYKLIKYNPSLITHSSIFMALKLLDRKEKLKLLEQHKIYSYEEIKEVFTHICSFINLKDNRNYKCVLQKFSTKEFYYVSSILENIKSKN